ncbi:MAG: hypothetical protein ACI4PJ_00165 [Acutalibacteraceae bacterium]
MKKIFHSFLASLIFVFSGLNIVVAGGVNKTDVLSDGTVLRYVSSDKIPELAQEYKELAQEISESKLSSVQDISIRMFSGILGTLGYVVSSNVFADPSVILGTKAISLLFGVVGFLYPDYHEYKINQKLINSHETKDAKQYIRMHEFSNIRGQLTAFCRDKDYDDGKQAYESGLVVVLRPSHKQKKRDGLRGLHSGVYSQKSMDEGGYRDLLKAIEQGW